MSLRGGRQPTWQPLSPHQAVADCDAHPRDHSLLPMSGTNSWKLLLRRWFMLFSAQKLSVMWQSSAFGGNYGENGERRKGGRISGVKVWGREYLSSHPFRLILTWSCHTTVWERVCVCACSFICVHRKSWVWCFDWPRVYACNPWALILRTCCCLSAVCWPKELSHNQGVKC